MKKNNKLELLFVFQLYAQICLSQNIDTVYFEHNQIHIKDKECLTVLRFDVDSMIVENKHDNHIIRFDKVGNDTIGICANYSKLTITEKRKGVFVLLFTDFLEAQNGILRLIYYKEKQEFKLQYMKGGNLEFISDKVSK